MNNIKGYKIFKIKVKNDKIFYDVALFGENSLVIEDNDLTIQLCEKILENITYEEKQKIEKEFDKELLHNFINEMLIIF